MRNWQRIELPRLSQTILAGGRSRSRQDGVRDVPDVALFAAGQEGWGHAYVYCMSDSNPDGNVYGYPCVYSNATDAYYNISGGTSMFPTWNDYSENTEISPSTGIGWSFLDLASYYLTRFKTGEWPAIVRDVIYVSHRVQFANTPPETSGGKTSLMRLVSAPASSPSRDDVEVLSFLTATSTIEVDIGGSTQQVVASAGESASLSPLAPGQISAQVVRNGQVITSVASPYIVQTSFPIQDESYRIVSSGRDGSTFVNTTPPTAIITSPETSATVSGEIPVAVTAYDDVGVTKVELYVDGNLVATTTTVPYDFTIDTTSLSKGTHILQAQAYDAAANIGTSPSVSVTVSSLVDLRRPRRGSRLSFELRPEEKGNDLPFTWITPGSARAALCGCFSGTSGRAAGRP
jgi:Bacterial Ig domain/Glycosyl hydrolase family 71